MATTSNLTVNGILTRTASSTRTAILCYSATLIHLNEHRPRATSSTILRSLAVDSRRTKTLPHSIRCLSSADSGLEELVKKTVADNLVVVYSKSWCPYSVEVKSLFKQLGVQPLVVELDELGSQGTQIQDVLEKITGQHTVPYVFIGGRHIGGCTDTLELHQKGELQHLLVEAAR